MLLALLVSFSDCSIINLSILNSNIFASLSASSCLILIISLAAFSLSAAVRDVSLEINCNSFSLPSAMARCLLISISDFSISLVNLSISAPLLAASSKNFAVFCAAFATLSLNPSTPVAACATPSAKRLKSKVIIPCKISPNAVNLLIKLFLTNSNKSVRACFGFVKASNNALPTFWNTPNKD